MEQIWYDVVYTDGMATFVTASFDDDGEALEWMAQQVAKLPSLPGIEGEKFWMERRRGNRL